jgi:hypothetical protein
MRNRSSTSRLVVSLCLLTGLVCVAGGPLLADDASNFDRTVAPLLARRCFECHSAAERKGGLDLTSAQTALKGGESGPVIVPGKPDDSLLWQHVSGDEMPPKKPLPAAEKTVLQAWIAAGAKWGTDPIDPFRFTTVARAGYDWWALQPVARPALPQVRAADWPQNPIDVFVAAQLDTQQLHPSPQAERRVLIRRLSFDLLGLPPAPAHVDAFVEDDSPDAYEKLVDRLLASPHYGERWARHWLDVIRFGESQGFERDKLRDNSWRYRDWVVESLNRDLPYDQFARLQLAGDVLRPADAGAVIATGFLVAGPYDEVGQSQQSAAMKAVVRQDELEDIVSSVGQTFLGLTINCARCHDHKFDAIRQSEYYQLTAALGGVKHGERDLNSEGLKAAAAERSAAIDGQIASLVQRTYDLEHPQRDRTEQAATNLSPDQQTQIQHLKFEIEHLKLQRDRQRATRIYAVTPAQPAPAFVLNRGNPADQGPRVAPGGVSSLVGVNADFSLSPDAPDTDRRQRLANWIADAHNPLFARVIVNRLWHYHFGVGLVDTPNDFGFNGARPTHPELLDWLAAELVRQDFSLKAIQRLIVTSATYRQGSRYNPAAAAVDADNRLLWRKEPLRLEAEVLRDAMLTAGGEINLTVGGPGYYDFTTFTRNTQFYEMLDPVGHSFNRRSLYRTWVRSGRNPLLDVFDCPDPSTKTPRRAVTTTPLQALSLLNNSFVLRMSNRLADRLQHEAGADIPRQITLAYQLTYGRSPEPSELETLTPFVTDHDLPALCRVLFNSSEFLYID